MDVIFKGFFHLFHPVNLRYDTRQRQPLDGILNLRRAAAFLNQLILETGILFGEPDGDIVVSKPCLFDLV